VAGILVLAVCGKRDNQRKLSADFSGTKPGGASAASGARVNPRLSQEFANMLSRFTVA
jgi:hypothetical protein